MLLSKTHILINSAYINKIKIYGLSLVISSFSRPTEKLICANLVFQKKIKKKKNFGDLRHPIKKFQKSFYGNQITKKPGFLPQQTIFIIAKKIEISIFLSISWTDLGQRIKQFGKASYSDQKNRYFTQIKNFLRLPSKNYFFERKKCLHLPKETNFQPKEKISHTYAEETDPLSKKKFFYLPKKSIFEQRKNSLLSLIKSFFFPTKNFSHPLVITAFLPNEKNSL